MDLKHALLEAGDNLAISKGGRQSSPNVQVTRQSLSSLKSNQTEKYEITLKRVIFNETRLDSLKLLRLFLRTALTWILCGKTNY